MVSLNATAIGIISEPAPFTVRGLTIEARIPCCSNRDVVCLKSGVVLPGKQAGVKRPELAALELPAALAVAVEEEAAKLFRLLLVIAAVIFAVMIEFVLLDVGRAGELCECLLMADEPALY